MMNKEMTSWEEVSKMISAITNMIIADDFTVDYVAPIPKGGWPVAALLAQHLRVKKSLSISQDKSTRPVTTYVANKDILTNCNILVIEDSIETGNGLFGARDEFVRMGANAKTVALCISPSYKGSLPNYYYGVGYIPLFPWEITY